jgi:cytochrome c peroxidase
LVGHGVDGDGDQVADELSVGDMTAMTVYVAAQPRPVTTLELSQLGLGAAVPFQQVVRIQNGETLFRQVGCADCHKPSLEIDVPVFQEPSAHPAYRDTVFPAGQSPLAESLRADAPIAFDLTADQPQNRFVVNGRVINIGALKRSPAGKGIVSLYGDLKRHRMGAELAEPIDETGAGADAFLTENLWGCGSTAPYMHDGRATTLTEAILLHGGEALASREAFRALTTLQQRDVIDFLNSLVLMKGGVPIGQ